MLLLLIDRQILCELALSAWLVADGLVLKVMGMPAPKPAGCHRRKVALMSAHGYRHIVKVASTSAPQKCRNGLHCHNA